MKNFIMLTDSDGEKYGVSVSNIASFEDYGNYSRIFFKDFVVPNRGNWRLAKERVAEIAQKLEKATEEKAEFVHFIFTNFNDKICVRKSEIRYLKEGEKKWHKVYIEGMGEIEVYGDFGKIVEAFNPVTIYGS